MEEATRLAHRIAGTPSTNAEDVHVKARLLAEVEDARHLPATMLAALLMNGLNRETKLVAAGKIPVA